MNSPPRWSSPHHSHVISHSLYSKKIINLIFFQRENKNFINDEKVEYAMEAVGHAGTCMGILAKDGIVLCAEKKNQHKLLDINPLAAEKIFQIDDHVAVGIAGITADANALIEQLRLSGKLLFPTGLVREC